MKKDVTIRRDGGLFLFEPQTEAARRWVSENVVIESYQWVGTAFALDDMRMAMELAESMKDADLVVGDSE